MKMHTPNHENHGHDRRGQDRSATARSGHDERGRVGFWLRAIELRKHELTREYRRGLKDVAREGISDEDYATTLATLEAMARNLGWDETQKPFGRRGFQPGRGHRHPAMLRGFRRMPHARPDLRVNGDPAEGPAA